MIWLYTLGTIIYSVLLHLAALIGHAKATKILRGRLSTKRIPSEQIPKDNIWVHVASLGEYQQIKPILRTIKEAQPTQKIVLSFYSPSGYENTSEDGLYDLKFYLPLDTPWAMASVINKIEPKALLLSKYDIWPNLMRLISKKGVRSYLFSAVFYPRQIYFRWYGGFFRKALRALDFIYVQNSESLKQLEEIYPSERIDISGDLRISAIQEDSKIPERYREIEMALNGKKALIAGSCYLHEADMILDYINHTDAPLLLVPHDVDDKSIKKWESRLENLVYSKYSQGVNPEHRIILIDTIGMLHSLYQYAQVCYIGGGFGKGIHNIVEPAIYGVPVIFGPKSKGFPEAEEFVSHGVAIQIQKQKEFMEAYRILESIDKESASSYFNRFFDDQRTRTTDVTQAVKRDLMAP